MTTSYILYRLIFYATLYLPKIATIAENKIYIIRSSLTKIGSCDPAVADDLILHIRDVEPTTDGRSPALTTISMLEPGTQSVKLCNLSKLGLIQINVAILVQISQMRKVFLQKPPGTENLLATTLLH